MFVSKSALGLIVAAAAGLALPAVGHAATLNVVCSGSTCTSTGSFGTVTASGGGTSLTYTFTITNGGDLHGDNSGLDTLLMDVGGTITSASATGGGFTWTDDTSIKGDGLGSSNFDLAFAATGCGTGGNCGTTATVTILGSGLVADSFTLNGFTILAGADLTCVPNGTNVCTNVTGFNTGAVGATLTATPLPGAALLFGSVLFGGLGVSNWRKRRSGGSTTSVLA
jgi:hypothetical protein